MVEGLQYVPDYLDTDTEAALVNFIDQQPWRNDLARRVQHHGYVYDYRTRQIRPDMYLGEIPAPFATLAQRLVAGGHFARLPDQVIVNEYMPGQGIAPHTDCILCFGDTIASVSLLSACEMEFLHPPTGQREALYLEPGSLLVLSGPARYHWRHTIRPRRSDVVGGVRLQRTRRLSLTFRSVRLQREMKPFR
ncbi:alpha-ketoglutarate-dependent dioxygenase AlkB [Parvularcula flava]|uniref:Alpha-ketoglutarate-dependent dioxygenase AlkB n=1 Tax=Aquisalinus luteolus TaxID=1566827 RepID=A0ABX0HE52_9PROT|nr:alpha-ketoglutarate-dependent dioxygenase AlkB [Aquisalinus luteolus]